MAARKTAKTKRNPGVPVMAMNPQPKGRKMAKGKRKSTPRRRRRKSNPGNPSNPRRRMTRRRTRRRSNPSGGGWEALKSVGLMVVGAIGGAALGWGLRQTSLAPKTAALVQAGASVVGGGAIAMFASPEVGGGLAATGGVQGVMSYMDAAPGGGGTSPNPPAKKARALNFRNMLARRGMSGLDDEGTDALGLVTAALSGVDDDEEMGAVTAQLQGVEDDDNVDDDGMGEADDDDDDGMGAVSAQLEGADDDDDGMGEAGDDDDGMGEAGYGGGYDDDDV